MFAAIPDAAAPHREGNPLHRSGRARRKDALVLVTKTDDAAHESRPGETKSNAFRRLCMTRRLPWPDRLLPRLILNHVGIGL